MARLRVWLEHIDEPIESVVIGHDENESKEDKTIPRGKLITFPEFQETIIYKDCFDDGWGSYGLPPLTFWTKSHVYFVTEFDGAVGIGRAPRNPIDYIPYYCGDFAVEE